MLYNPPHPGMFIKNMYLAPLGLTVTTAAFKLNVTRKALSELINGKTGISIEMALRLEKAFNVSAESWLTQQMHYDLWKIRKENKNLEVCELWQPPLTTVREGGKDYSSFI